MTRIEDRLERTAADYRAAAYALPVGRRARRTCIGPAAQQPHRPLVVALATMLLLTGALTAVGVVAYRQGPQPVVAADWPTGQRLPPDDDAIIARPELLTAFRRLVGPDDALPDLIRDAFASRLAEMDWSAARAGPSADGVSTYVVPSGDGQTVCAFGSVEGRGAGGTCDSVAGFVTSPGLIWASGDEGTYGLVADDVTAVEVNGERALLADGMFLAAGIAVSDETVDITVFREPAREALIGACDDLAPMLVVQNRVIPIDESEADALVRSAESVDDASFRQLAAALEPLAGDGLDVEEMRKDQGGLIEAAWAAAATCERALVPGWTTVFQDPDGAQKNPPSPPTVDLDGFGRRQDLVPTEVGFEPADRAIGPGLEAVTRAEIGDSGVVVFTWNQTRPNQQACFAMRTPNRSSSQCQGLGPGERDASFIEEMDEGQLVAVGNDARASFATARVDDQTWTQQASGPYFVFALPPGRVTVSLHKPDGSVLGDS